MCVSVGGSLMLNVQIEFSGINQMLSLSLLI